MPSKEQINNLLQAYEASQYIDAEKLAHQLTLDFPEHPFAWKVLGVILSTTGRLNESLDIHTKLIELAPHDFEAHFNMGNVFHKLGSLENAITQHRTAISLNPSYYLAHNNLGTALYGLGRLEESKASYTDALSLQPSYHICHTNLGATLQAMGKSQDALASYRRAIDLSPKHIEAHTNLGLLHRDLGELDEAIVCFERAITLEAGCSDAYFNLAMTFQDLGRLESAEKTYRRLIALKDDHPQAHDRLGFVLQSMGRFDEAEICYQKYISLESHDLSFTKSKGSNLFYKGDYLGALELFDRYDTRDSRGFALECLYALDRTPEIFDRLEANFDIDSKNLRVAAIAAFVAEVEQKETANNFCNNPLDFVHLSNLSSHVENADLFVRDTIAELSNVKTIWSPATKTTVNGFQADIDVFKYPAENMSLLKLIIIEELDSYFKKFKDESCTFITKWPSQKKISGWHVILKQHGYQSFHIHPDGWLSGVIYLTAVPSLDNQEGAIEFSYNSGTYFDPRARHIVFQPEAGDIVFFPSSLHHRTIPFSTDRERICVSFDLAPSTEG